MKAAKRRGRPKKDSAKRKTASLLLKMEENEKAGFSAAAELAGAPLSVWIRERLRAAASQELKTGGKEVPFLS
ncbi:MAG TPA: hypothetical protein VHR66_16745 [Gemmataceae bacterium]|jgi:hypothetical protein|nr:hypothetical protein [Gemmataceae bacterium]